MSYINAEMLTSLGIEVTGGDGGRNIQARCPVHHLITGRPDAHPSWYIATETGLWICFSCKQRGTLYTLLDLMDIDREVLGELPVRMLEDQAASLAADEIAKENEPERPYISRYAFHKFPFPPIKLLDLRDIALDACRTHDVRWSQEKRCFLIPIYAITGELLGWQEKATGYFNNVPDEVKKSHALFGFDQLHGRAIMVESPLDVCRLTTYGFEGGVATLGSEVSDIQVEAVANQASRVVLAFDNDHAGHEATESVANRLKAMGIEVLYFLYPRKREGKDPGELSYKSLMSGIANARHFTGLRALSG